MLSILMSISYLVHLMYSIIFFFMNGFKFFSSVSCASNLGNMALWRKAIMVCGPYSQCLSGASLGNPNHVMATKGHREALSLDRCGLLEVLLHQDIHHILCDNQEWGFYTFQLTIDTDIYFHLIVYLFIITTQSRCVPTHGETVRGERRWQALNSHCL